MNTGFVIALIYAAVLTLGLLYLLYPVIVDALEERREARARAELEKSERGGEA